jgi:hypothetical protein
MPDSSGAIRILWSNDSILSHLRSAFGEGNVFEDSGLFFSFNKLAVAGFAVLAEHPLLDSTGTGFVGMDAVCRLRMEKRIVMPIVVCSFMQEEFMVKRFPILMYPQHHPYLRLPASPEDIKTTLMQSVEMDEFRLREVIEKYCDPVGRAFHLLTHSHGFRMLQTQNENLMEMRQVIDEDVKQFRNLLSALPAKVQKAGQHFCSQSEDLGELDASELKTSLTKLIDLVSNARKG